jgi:hypothetical protein
MSHPRRRYRCRYCGYTLLAWLPGAKWPNGAMLLNMRLGSGRDGVADD